jgi:RecB family endonuclease NucS
MAVVTQAGEELRITLDEIFHDSSHDLGVESGLVKDGVEAHLQSLLAALASGARRRIHAGAEGVATAIGPVDLLCRDGSGATVAVEVKAPW